MIGDYYTKKTCLITGGSSGIGLSLACQLAGFGANVFILARRLDVLEDAIKTISQSRQTPEQQFGFISADVADEKNLCVETSAFLEQHGTPDFLINSAGVTRPGEFLELDSEIFNWQMQINYLGTVNMIRLMVPGMIERKSGHIINIISMAGVIGLVGYTAYCGSKFAVRGFSDALRSELRIHNIKMSVVYPSDVDTPQLHEENKYKPALTRALVEGNSTIMKPEKCAEIILKDASRGKYTITPGFDISLLYFLRHLLGDQSYRIVDYLVSKAQKKVDADRRNGDKNGRG